MTVNQSECAASRPKPNAADAVHDPFATVTAVMGLAARQCRWPEGEPGRFGFHFCGARTGVGEVYCAAHLRRSLHRSERRAPGALHRLERARRAAGGEAPVAAERTQEVAGMPSPPPASGRSTSRSDGDAGAGRRLARGVLQRQLFGFLRRQPQDVDLASARDIARLLGLKPETVRGQLSRFEARGWIRRQPFKLLHDPTVGG